MACPLAGSTSSTALASWYCKVRILWKLLDGQVAHPGSLPGFASSVGHTKDTLAAPVLVIGVPRKLIAGRRGLLRLTGLLLIGLLLFCTRYGVGLLLFCTRYGVGLLLFCTR